MLVSLVDSTCYVYRQPGDPVLRPNWGGKSWSPPGWYAAESRLLYKVQQILNRRGYGLLKKRMWRDGHMYGCEHTQYLRSRTLGAVPSLYLYHADSALEVAAESYNVLGQAVLDVVYGAGREDDPIFERACREWVRRREAHHPCYEVSWEGDATIDGHTAARRLYRAFTDPDAAMAFVASEPGDSCRLLDRTRAGWCSLKPPAEAGSDTGGGCENDTHPVGDRPMTITASCKFHNQILTDITVLNPGGWFGKTWLIEIGGSYTPLFLVVEADSISDAIDELSDDPVFGHSIHVPDEDLGDYPEDERRYDGSGRVIDLDWLLFHGREGCDLPMPVQYHAEGEPAGIDPRHFAAWQFN